NFVQLELFGSKKDALIKFFPEAFQIHSGWVNPILEIRESVGRTWSFAASKVTERLGLPGAGRRGRPHYRLFAGFGDALLRRDVGPPVSARSVIPTLDILDALHDAF